MTPEKRKFLSSVILFGMTFFFILWVFNATNRSLKPKKNSKTIPSELPWFEDEQEARKAALAQKKPIFIEFMANWCEACQTLEETTLQETQVIQTLKNHFILLRLDISKEKASKSHLLDKFAISVLPTLGILAWNQERLEKQFVLVGLSSTREFLHFLQKPF